MKKIADWENMSIIAFMCYILPVVIAFEALVSGYLAAGLAALAVFIILRVSPDSRLRYHSIQAVMTLIATALIMGLSYWVMFGVDRERMALSDGTGALVSFSMMIIVWCVIIVIFGGAYLYAAIKAALGKDVCLIGIGNLARWMAQDLPGTMAQTVKDIKSAPAKIVSGEYRLQERKFELAMVTAVVMALAVLAVKVPGFLWPQPQVPPPSGITVAAIGTAESFVGFPWGSDVDSTRKIAGDQGWKTGEYVSSMTGLGCRAVVEGYPALLQFFYVREEGTPRYLHQGFLIMHDRDGPIETIYQRILAVMTEKYGSTDEVGYPPWRSPGTKPFGYGYGWKWETTSEQGQKVNVFLTLELEQSKTNPNSYIPTSLQVRYKNLTIEEKSYKRNQQ